MYKNLTSSGSATVSTGAASQVLITVNAALTGTITISDGSTTVGTITNPGVGNSFRYWDFGTSVVVNPSATCDITVNATGSYGPK